MDEVSVMTEVVEDPEGELEGKENLSLVGVGNSMSTEEGGKSGATQQLLMTMRVIAEMKWRCQKMHQARKSPLLAVDHHLCVVKQ